MPYPSSALRILRGVPWDNSYNHVRRFTNQEEQLSYMQSKVAYNVSDSFAYIKNIPGTPLRVELTEAQLVNCNYIMYQNTAYGNKWFFGFITRIEYSSDNVSLIYWETDLFQSWYFQFDLAASYVEREHTNDDTIGANTIPEGLECGPYVVGSAETDYFDGLGYVVIATTDASGGHHFRVVNNVYSGLFMLFAKNADALTTMLQAFIDAGLENAILCVYMAPLLGFDATESGPGRRTSEISKPYTSIDGYIPKNNKLFVYPYNYMLINNNSGQSNELRYELWSGTKCTFETLAVAVTMPEGYYGPTNYRGLDRDFDNGLTLKNFPQCGFSGDTFKAWWAQNKNSMLTSATGGAVSSVISGAISGAAGGGIAGSIIPGVGTVAGAVIGGALGAVGSIFSTATNSLSEYQHIQALPDSSRGQAQTESLQASIYRNGITRYALTIQAEYAKRIDDYFSLFGYKTNRVKYPNTHGRKSWNFVKTIDANVGGPVPVEAKTLFETILNRGVTFWHVDDIGNYALDNSIV